MTQKHVAITGASRGIGKAIAERFLKANWVVWALNRNPEIDPSLKALGDIRGIPFDASSGEQVQAAAEALKKQTSSLQVLVNNAGIAISAPAVKTSNAQLASLLAINVTAPFLLARELFGLLAASGEGRLINIASIAALRGIKYTSAYCASKHALLGMTRALAHEWAAQNITVNAICPGWTDTDMFSDSVKMVAASTKVTADMARERLASMSPLKRVVQADEVAEVAFFLAASSAAGSMTGGAFPIDAGESL